MAVYYPKSKILENQFTNGNDFVLKDNNQKYIGYYYSLSNNKYYTGKTPEANNPKELIRVTPKKPSIKDINLPDASFTTEFKIPVPYYPVVSKKDYDIGFFSRYFMRRRNSDFTSIVEISPGDYKKYFTTKVDVTNLYVATKINWKISGPEHNNFSDKNFPKAGVIETNKRLVELKEKLFPGISLFIKDYSLYAKFS